MRLLPAVLPLLALASCALPPPPPVGAGAAVLPEASCRPFRWGESRLAGNRAGVLVPVMLDGRPYHFHLDTGADRSAIYGGVAGQRGWTRVGSDAVEVPAASLAGSPLNPAHFRAADLAMPYDGTLGLDLLAGKIVVLDYPGQRICVLSPADLARAEQQFSWQPATLRDRRLFVPVRFGTERYEGLYFDAGDPFAGVSLDWADWQRFTGLTDPMTAPEQRTGMISGRATQLVGAPSALPFSVAAVDMGRPMIFSHPTEPHFWTEGRRRRGLFGNRAVWDRIVILDLRANARFGVAR